MDSNIILSLQSLTESQRSIVADALFAFPRGSGAPWVIFFKKFKSRINLLFANSLAMIPIFQVGFTAYFLFEFACGYALFEAHGVNELHISNRKHPLSLHFKSHEEYINRPHQTFTLKAFHPFSSTADALVQMNAISNCKLITRMRSLMYFDPTSCLCVCVLLKRILCHNLISNLTNQFFHTYIYIICFI